jgi:hypothetical protein
MEGVASEAASLAGHLQLGKLIYLYDDNRVTLSAGTDMTFTEDARGGSRRTDGTLNRFPTAMILVPSKQRCMPPARRSSALR